MAPRDIGIKDETRFYGNFASYDELLAIEEDEENYFKTCSLRNSRQLSFGLLEWSSDRDEEKRIVRITRGQQLIVMMEEEVNEFINLNLVDVTMAMLRFQDDPETYHGMQALTEDLEIFFIWENNRCTVGILTWIGNCCHLSMECEDFIELVKSTGRVCGTCCRPIKDRYILQVVDTSYHERCLQCYACGDRLYQTCFVKESKPFCRIDYDRLYAKKCLGCSERISPEELVMRTCENVFHVRCFACVVCGMRLQKGDQYIFKQGQVFCKPDYEKEVEMLQGIPHVDYFCDDIIQTARTVDGRRGPKRPRTILTTQQRRAFKASFEVSPKPCRKVRETLAKDTGLSIRIVQVWFQNQRAKMKKMKKKAGDAKGSELDNEDKKLIIKEEEQSPQSTQFMNDSDSENGKSDIYSHIKNEQNIFVNIKEEPDGREHYFKAEDANRILHHAALSSGKFNPAYAGFPFGNLDASQLSMIMTPPPAHKNIMTHGVHLDINPIDRLYSMQNSYFCGNEAPLLEH